MRSNTFDRSPSDVSFSDNRCCAALLSATPPAGTTPAGIAGGTTPTPAPPTAGGAPGYRGLRAPTAPALWSRGGGANPLAFGVGGDDPLRGGPADPFIIGGGAPPMAIGGGAPPMETGGVAPGLGPAQPAPGPCGCGADGGRGYLQRHQSHQVGGRVSAQRDQNCADVEAVARQNGMAANASLTPRSHQR